MVCAHCAAAVASAANNIRLWEGASEHCALDQVRRWVTITWPGHYKLEALDQANLLGLGDIDHITVDLDPYAPPGPISVTVARDPNYTGGDPFQPGAVNVKEVKLGNVPDARIADLLILGDLAELSGFEAADITGLCVIGTPGNFSSGYVLNTITLGCLTGTLQCNGMQNLTVDGCVPEQYSAQVVVEGPYNATMDLNTNLYKLAVGGPVGGTIRISGSITRVDLSWGIHMPGLLEIGGEVRAGEIWGGIGPGAVVRLGSTGPLHSINGFIVRPRSDDPDNTGLDGLLEVLGNAGDIHVRGGYTRGVLHIHGDAGTLGFDDDLVGLCHVEGDVTRYIIMGTLQDDPYPLLTGDLVGELRIDGSLFSEGWEYGLKIQNGRIAPTGRLVIGGDLAADVEILAGDLAGTITVGRDIDPAMIFAAGDISGAIDVLGDLAQGGIVTHGSLVYDPQINPAGGHVAIYGAFGAAGQNAGIVMWQPMVGDAFICVDYDGYDLGDVWGPQGEVKIGTVYYYGPDPERGLFIATPCKGDANGDGAVDTSDTDGMLKAIEGPAAYAAAYRALAGSWLFHCDLGGPLSGACDGLVNMADFDYFLRRWGQCSPLCGDLSSEQLTPAEAAAALGGAVAPELTGELLTVTDELAVEHPAAPVREYWDEVHNCLE
jgi:hypothetical protein